MVDDSDFHNLHGTILSKTSGKMFLSLIGGSDLVMLNSILNNLYFIMIFTLV